MAIQKVKLISKKEIAEGVIALFFEKPQGFTHIPGQFAEWTLLNPAETDDEGDTRAFSFASTPHEDHLMVVSRLRDTAFKRTIHNLAIGTEVSVDGPYGNFVLHTTEATPAVFLIGGIGITPIRSIIAQATKDMLPQQIILLYANRKPEDAVFLADFTLFSQQNSNFTFVPVVTRVEGGEWTGETGHITKEMVLKYVKDVQKPIYYLSGPVSMVKAMQAILEELEVDEDAIKAEEFSGY